MLNNIEATEDNVIRELENIFQVAEDAAATSEDAMGLSDEALGMINEISNKVGDMDYGIWDIKEKVDALLKKFYIENPKVTNLRIMVKRFIKAFLEKNIISDKKEFIDTLEKSFPDSSKKQLENWYDEVINEN